MSLVSECFFFKRHHKPRQRRISSVNRSCSDTAKVSDLKIQANHRSSSKALWRKQGSRFHSELFWDWSSAFSCFFFAFRKRDGLNTDAYGAPLRAGIDLYCNRSSTVCQALIPRISLQNSCSFMSHNIVHLHRSKMAPRIPFVSHLSYAHMFTLCLHANGRIGLTLSAKARHECIRLVTSIHIPSPCIIGTRVVNPVHLTEQ